MSKINQRVIDLSKIDTPEKAFLAGYCCCSTEFNYFKKALVNNEIHIEIPMSDENHVNMLDFLVNNFDVEVIEKYNDEYAEKIINKLQKKNVDVDLSEARWMKVLKSYNVIIKITEESKIWFTGKLPTVKKELYPHLISGLIIKNGFIKLDGNLEIIQFMNKHALELLKKQFKQWYDIESSDIQQREIEGRKMYYLIISPFEYIRKFNNLLVSDYKNLSNNYIFQKFFDK